MPVSMSLNGSLDLTPLRQLKKRTKIISILRKAVRAGNKIVREAMKGAVPLRTQALRVSISTKVSVSSAWLSATGVIGPRSKYVKTYKKKEYRPARYAHLVDNAKPFLKPTLDSKKAQFVAAVNQVIADEIAKALA